MAAADPAIPAGDRDQRAELTLARQHVILGEQRPALTVVVGEPALRPGIVSQTILGEQAGITAVKVLPDAASTQARGSGPVTIF